jgi:TRAP-type mannitol/chloroaromatic compound transport system permease small subunit
MPLLLAISKVIDTITAFVGKAASWLILVAVLISAGNAVIRKLFDISSNAWLEVQWYLFGAVFLLAAAYVLQKNEHIRIDIFSSGWSKQTRDVIDLLLHTIFLLPFTVLMLWLAVPWFLLSFQSGEISGNASGLIMWPAKSFLVGGFALLVLQTVSEIIKRFAVVTGYVEEPENSDNDKGRADANGEVEK